MSESPPAPETPRIETERLWLAAAAPDLAPAVAAFHDKNRDHFFASSPERPEPTDEAFWRAQLIKAEQSFRDDRGLRLYLFAKEAPAGPVLGQCAFTEIVRGPFQACYLGYSLDHDQEGKGLMQEALRAAIPFVFGRLGLHRIMANYRPDNLRSARLLRSLGFMVEGFARDYLFLGGAWQDHVLTSLINPPPSEP
jgi:ribosomal-protein-alanine N-acetyltransferase